MSPASSLPVYSSYYYDNGDEPSDLSRTHICYAAPFEVPDYSATYRCTLPRSREPTTQSEEQPEDQHGVPHVESTDESEADDMLGNAYDINSDVLYDNMMGPPS